MNKEIFMTRLENGIANLPLSERQEILADYREHFLHGTSSEESEEAICARLGDPDDIAKEYGGTGFTPVMADTPVQSNALPQNAPNQTQQQTSSNWDVGMQVVAGLAIAALTFCVTLPVAGSLVGVLLAFYGVGIALVAVGIGLGVLSIAGVAMVFAMLFLISFGILWLIGTAWLTKWFCKGIVWYVRACISIISSGRWPEKRVSEVQAA